MATTNLLQYLNKTGVPFELLSHVPAFSAHDVAAATHIPIANQQKQLLSARMTANGWLCYPPIIG